MTRDDLLEFMRSEKYATQTSVSPSGRPQAAVVGIVVSIIEIVFDTLCPPERPEPAHESGCRVRDWRHTGWRRAHGPVRRGNGRADGAELEQLLALYLRGSQTVGSVVCGRA